MIEMIKLLHENGFPVDLKGGKYIPHLTIMKVRRWQCLRDYKKDFELLKNCDEHFGSQLVSHVQLLAMKAPKDDKGYYKCVCQIDTTDLPTPIMDHSVCCAPIPDPNEVNVYLSWRRT